jgi:2-keto-3-deoxy-L-rhamnonate aldolase RhmA
MNNFKKELIKKKFILNGWLSIPNSFTAESMSKMGWDNYYN